MTEEQIIKFFSCYEKSEKVELMEAVLKIYDFKFKIPDPKSLLYEDTYLRKLADFIYSEWIRNRIIIHELDKEQLFNVAYFVQGYCPILDFGNRMTYALNNKAQAEEAIIQIKSANSVFDKDANAQLNINAKPNIQKDYYRYDLSPEDNETFKIELDYLIELLEHDIDERNDNNEEYKESQKKVLVLKNILNNVKHIEVSDKKIKATERARKVNKNRSRNKVQKAYEDLKLEDKKITIYSIAKKANLAHPTAAKHQDIFKEDLV